MYVVSLMVVRVQFENSTHSCVALIWLHMNLNFQRFISVLYSDVKRNVEVASSNKTKLTSFPVKLPELPASVLA